MHKRKEWSNVQFSGCILILSYDESRSHRLMIQRKREQKLSSPFAVRSKVNFQLAEDPDRIVLKKVGVDWDVGPPVPIPNTEVKHISADDTCRATGRENR